jgi:hypothetical protein
MKITSLIAVTFLWAFSIHAQTNDAGVIGHPAVVSEANNLKPFASAGCVDLGGSVSFISQSYSTTGGGSEPSVTNFLFAPYVGYFPVKGFEVGLNPFSVNISGQVGSMGTTYSILLAPSYNFSTGSIAYPFLEAEIGFYGESDNSLGVSQSSSGLSFGSRAGVKMEITKHGMLNFSFQYLQYNLSSNGVSTGSINNLIIGLGFTIHL